MNNLNPTAEAYIPRRDLIKVVIKAPTVVAHPENPTDSDESSPINPLETQLKSILPQHRLISARRNQRVHKVVRDGGGEAYALKQTDKSVEKLECLKNEARISRELLTVSGKSHPAIRACFALHEGPDCTPFLQLEYCARTLHHFQSSFPQRKIPEYIAKFLMTQLLAGIEWMHSKYIIHRDLHPKHIMINGATQPVLKIIGLGKATHEDEVKDRYIEGHPYYCPPDIHLGACSYGTEYDIWSVGCIFTEMMFGLQAFRPPSIHRGSLVTYMIHVLHFGGLPGEHQRGQRLATLPWDAKDASWPWHVAFGLHKLLGRYWSSQSASFLNSFLQFDPEARISAAEAQKSPYLVIAEESTVLEEPATLKIPKKRRKGNIIAYEGKTPEDATAVINRFPIEEEGILEKLLGCVQGH